jgi:organic hydroperoxide reductase OsmC/OhrA
MPKALGGANDDFTNPEMLFAAGYSACFDSALNRVISLSKVKTGETTVTAQVSIGQLKTEVLDWQQSWMLIFPEFLLKKHSL